MATIRDIYQLDTYANTAGLNKAEGEVTQLDHAIEKTGRDASQASGKVAGLGGSLSGLGGIARGLGSALKGLALGLGALAAGAIVGLPRLFKSIRGAMEETGKSAAGVGQSARAAAAGAAEATRQVGGLMGAWGEVGAGYVMAAGQKATEVASTATETADEVEDAMDRSGAATSRFGQVLDRIGKRWEELKNIVLRALGKALLPLLEKFLAFLEDPATQKFVELLAQDLANAVAKVADWVSRQAIPAIQGWIVKINEMGGPIAALKSWWDSLKTTVLQIVAIILAEILRMTNYITTSLNTWKANFNSLKTIVDTVVAGIKTAFVGLRNTIATVFAGIVEGLKERINDILGYVNYVIGIYNEIAAKIGLPTLAPIGLLPTNDEGHAGATSIGTVIINANSAAEGRLAGNAFMEYLRGAAAAGIRAG
jgi:hypothetical protein